MQCCCAMAPWRAVRLAQRRVRSAPLLWKHRLSLQQLTRRRQWSSEAAEGTLAAAPLVAGALPAYRTARKSAEELEAPGGSRFPFADAFEMRKDLVVDAGKLIETLSPMMTEGRLQRLERVCANRTFNVLPIVEGLYDMGNLAAVCRSADALGFGAVHVVRSIKDERYKQSKRTSAGSEKWLDVQLFESTGECLQAAKRAGYQIVVTHLRADAVEIGQVDWTRPTAIVLGNEERGVSDEALALADACAVVPMVGFVDSYNISVAAALILWEARRIRLERLGYHGDLSEEEQRILKAVMLLRNKGQTREVIDNLLERPPPQWQQDRGHRDWGNKQFVMPGQQQPQRLQTTKCHFWDGSCCWGERYLWPANHKCRYQGAHNRGTSTLDKEKLKQQCAKRGLPFPDLLAAAAPSSEIGAGGSGGDARQCSGGSSGGESSGAAAEEAAPAPCGVA